MFFTLFIQKIDQDSLLDNAVIWSENVRFSSKSIPSSLYVLDSGLGWAKWILSNVVFSSILFEFSSLSSKIKTILFVSTFCLLCERLCILF